MLADVSGNRGAAALVGRDDLLQQLRHELDAGQSSGRVVGVLGEPGVGKSALIAQLALDARAAGFSVLNARGSQSETHLPFATLHELLHPLLPRADRLPPKLQDALLSCFGMGEATEVNPFFAALAVLELLAEWAAQAPLLVCLDDLQWMDQPSIDALSFVARRIGGERIVLLCTSRGPALRLADDQPATTFELPSLDDEAAAKLLAAQAPDLTPVLRARVLQQAGGNPLALIEFAAALQAGRSGSPEPSDDLPMTERLERAFAARAEELDPAARAVLDVAALDDGENLADVVAAAGIVLGAPVDLDAVPASVQRGLLTVADGTYAISRPLVRSALRHAMSPGRRQQVHAALATALAAYPHRAAWHRAASAPGPDERVAAELADAAIDAHRRGAISTALSWLERSAALTPDPDAQAARLLTAAELGYELGRFAQVEQLTARVAQLPLAARERSRLTWLEGVFHDGSRSEPADIRYLVELARRSAEDGDVDLAMQLMIGASRRVWWRDPGEQVRDEIVRAVRQLPVPADDPRLLAVLGLSESFTLTSVVLDRLGDWPVDAGGRPELAGLLGIAAFCVGDHGRAIAHLSSAIDALRGQGRLSLLAEALAIRSWAEICLGVFDGSKSADEAVRLADETGQAVWGATARVAVAVVDSVGAGSDRRSGLLAHAEQTALRMPNASSSLLSGVQLARGLGALGADRPEPAYGELQRVFVPTDPAYQRVQALWTISYFADAAVRTGRRDEALSVLAAMERLAGGAPALGPLIALEYSRAVLAEPESADELFRAALDGAGRPYPWHRARLELAYGSWLRRQRRVLDSRAPLRAARSTFTALGAHPWALRADHELRATGERGWRSVPNPREGLSPQESQIAALAASGLSNREIGERLFLSHRTVSSHLYRIFPKLGVTTRGQLAAALADTDAVAPTVI